MPKASLATRKFEKRHLADEIKRRKQHQKTSNAKVSAKKQARKPVVSAEPKEKSDLSASRHKEELEELRKADPNFVAYLEKNNAELLDFEADSDDDEDDLLDEEGDDEAQEAEVEEGAEDGAEESEGEEDLEQKTTMFTPANIKEWIKEVETKSSKPHFFKLLQAFFAATHIGMENVPKINSGETFTTIVTWCIPNVPKTFVEMYRQVADPKAKKDYVLLKNFAENKKAWTPRLKKLLKHYVKSLTSFLDVASDSTMITFALDNSVALVPLLNGSKELQTLVLKSVLSIWGSRDEASRISAFLMIREMCIHLAFPFLDTAFKSIYLSFVKNSKFVNKSTVKNIELMMRCVIELYSLDFVAAYQHAFVYIRQLAIHLKNTIANLSQATIQQVYNWQFFNSLQIWMKLITHYPREVELQPLHYPIIQMLFGVVKLHNSPKYLPLKLSCVRLLNEFAERSETFVNALPLLSEVMKSSQIRASPKPTKQKPINMKTVISVPQIILGTSVYQDQLLKELHLGFMQSFSIYSDSAAFPELVFPAVHFLKDNLTNIQTKDKKKFQNLLDLVKKQAEFITKKRSSSKTTLEEINQLKTFGSENKDNKLKQQFSMLKQLDEEDSRQDEMDEDDIRDENLDDESQALAANKRTRDEDDSSDESSEDEDEDENQVEDGGDDEMDGGDQLPEELSDSDEDDPRVKVKRHPKKAKKNVKEIKQEIKQEGGKDNKQIKKENKNGAKQPAKKEKNGAKQEVKKEIKQEESQVKKENGKGKKAQTPAKKKAKKSKEDLTEDLVEDFQFSDED